MNLTRGIDLKRVADKMSGASGAELKACCTEAGMFALRERRVHVTQEDFEMSVAKARGTAPDDESQCSADGAGRVLLHVCMRADALLRSGCIAQACKDTCR